MKWILPLSIVGLSIAFGVYSFAQGEHAAALPDNSYDGQRTGLGTSSKNATGATPTPGDDESNTDEKDDTLYHGKTSDMETTLLRDEGALHFKRKPKEHTREVNSLKDLPSSGTDPKFQGSFITSGVSSINKVAAKANSVEGTEQQTQTVPKAEPESNSHYLRHMSFPTPQDEKSKKEENASNPSPAPSASASPATRKSDDAKK